jgi:hypothetical protein
MAGKPRQRESGEAFLSTAVAVLAAFAWNIPTLPVLMAVLAFAATIRRLFGHTGVTQPPQEFILLVLNGADCVRLPVSQDG